MQTSNESLTVGELAGLDYRKAEVFRKYGIDFCCGGNQSLEAAAQKAGITTAELRSALEMAESASCLQEQDFSRWSLPQLIDRIVLTHHRYVREAIPALLEYSAKVAGHHGGVHPELIELDAALHNEAKDLLSHLLKEENVLFPAVRQLVAASVPGVRAEGLDFVRHCVDRMETEHSSSGESLDHFRALTHNYTLPEGACNSYRFLYEKLKEFDQDLQQHIHLENNILFPRAIALLQETSAQ